ncbi:MAG: D-serine ammonia-lyase [Mogibacterium sp.]|nr:D-serine ammonia-lyase [Mogibacterium sp.]
MKEYLDRIKNAEELCWINPCRVPAAEGLSQIDFSADDVADAEARLERFAPLIMHYFPETRGDGGIIESPLTELEDMKAVLNEEGARLTGRLFLKRDSDLKVSGSVKARGGVYEVLKHTEDLAIENGILTGIGDDYLKLASEEARKVFSRHKVQVGSTGNLGMSIGIMSAALGYEAIVHMSMDAKQWKKDLLRARGAIVVEYEGDYGAAVEQGRAESDADPMSYFVDDENSAALFLGYAVAAGRMKRQFKAQGIEIDQNHPLFVYLPCGVGGAPGGVTFGLKLLFGDNVHCFFVEPVNCPCMLVGLETGEMNNICVQDIGLSGRTEADGLAVGRPSGLICQMMNLLMAGEFTVDDSRLNEYLRKLYKSENLYIEPSACAAFIGPATISIDEDAKRYLRQNELEDKMADAVHVAWATGGSMVPQYVRNELLRG